MAAPPPLPAEDDPVFAADPPIPPPAARREALFDSFETPEPLRRVGRGADDAAFAELLLGGQGAGGGAEPAEPLVDRHGCGLLHYAAMAGRVDWVRRCREERGGVHWVVVPASGSQRTVAYYAAAGGQAAMLQHLAAALGRDLLRYPRDDGMTIADAAALEGYDAVLEEIEAQLGTEFLMQADNRGMTIAHSAAQEGHLDTLKYLERRLGSSFLRVTSGDGFTAAMAAAVHGRLRVLRYLEETLGPEFLRELKRGGRSISHVAASKPSGAWTLPYLASRLGDSALRVVDSIGSTIAFDAASCEDLGPLRFLAKRLGPSFLAQRQHYERSIALTAARYKRVPTIDFIVEHLGPDFLRLPGSFGRTAAHAAAENGAIEVLECLLRHAGVALLVQTDNGAATIAHLAAAAGQLAVIEWIRARFGSEFLWTATGANGLGHTVVHSAAMGGHLDLLKHMLRECGADAMRRPPQNTWTKLSAAAVGHVDVLEWLDDDLFPAAAGVSTLPSGRYGAAAVSAFRRGHVAAIEYVLSRGHPRAVAASLEYVSRSSMHTLRLHASLQHAASTCIHP